MTPSTFQRERESALQRWLLGAAITMIAPAAILLAFLIGSLLLTGGQVIDSRSAIWRPVLDWPVFTVSPWVVVPLAVGALITALGLAVQVDTARTVALSGPLGWAVAGALSSWFLAVVLPPTALAGTAFIGGTDLLLAAGASTLAAAVVLIRFLALSRRHDRLLADRLVPGGVLVTPAGLDERSSFTLKAPTLWRVVDDVALPPRTDTAETAALSIAMTRALRADPGRALVPVPGGGSAQRWEERAENGAIRIRFDFFRGDSPVDGVRLDATVRPDLLREQRDVEPVVATADTIAGTFRWRR